ncbi:MAG TPA: hypothetical protein VNU92_11625 [Edaphobacter sp.]|jgi:hypothetical protein|nr:hypothetical protein [Edaphobacter sp.]
MSIVSLPFASKYKVPEIPPQRVRRVILLALLALGGLSCAATLQAQCAVQRIPEMGLWQADGADPFQIEIIESGGCPDTNPPPNATVTTNYLVSAITRPSSGPLYHRPRVKAFYTDWTPSNGGVRSRWFRADVPVGGYVDHMYMRSNGQQLEVHIYHKSLDIKPSAWDNYTYRKIANR